MNAVDEGFIYETLTVYENNTLDYYIGEGRSIEEAIRYGYENLLCNYYDIKNKPIALLSPILGCAFTYDLKNNKLRFQGKNDFSYDQLKEMRLSLLKDKRSGDLLKKIRIMNLINKIKPSENTYMRNLSELLNKKSHIENELKQILTEQEIEELFGGLKNVAQKAGSYLSQGSKDFYDEYIKGAPSYFKDLANKTKDVYNWNDGQEMNQQQKSQYDISNLHSQIKHLTNKLVLLKQKYKNITGLDYSPISVAGANEFRKTRNYDYGNLEEFYGEFKEDYEKRFERDKVFTVTIITKEKEKQHPGKSYNSIGYHFSAENIEDAEALKLKYEMDGKYNGETISKVFISPKGNKMGVFYGDLQEGILGFNFGNKINTKSANEAARFLLEKKKKGDTNINVKNAVEKIENDIKSVITDETTISDFINQTKIIYKDLKILFTTIDDDRSRSWIGFEMSKSFTHVLTNINNFKFFKSIYFS